MTFELRPSIFREYDIRGIADSDLSSEFAECLGKAYAQFISNNTPTSGRTRLTVSVGRDCRLSSDRYADALIRGLTTSGLDVINLGVCPTPLTYFSVFHMDLDGGIMITGSHNPADYNGFKICVGKDTIHGSQIQEMRVLMQKINAQTTQSQIIQPQGNVIQKEIIPPYIEYLVQNAKTPLKNKKIVLDAGNGTASTVAPELFERLGAHVIPLFCELDGRFPHHHPDPTVPENLKQLIECVLKEKADFGLAFDGDSDRIGLVDEFGRVIFGDEMMVLFARNVLKNHPGSTIISEVKSSNRLYEDISRHGGKPLMWKTGHSLIKSKMKETRATLAGEMSGHIFFADRYFGFDDALYAGLRIFEIASESSGPLSSLLADLPKAVSTPEIRVDCQEEKKFQLVEETKRRLGNQYPMSDLDGIRVDFGKAWGLIRASNTQPVLVLRFEAENQNRLTEVRSLLESILVESANAIGHPALSLEG